METYPGNFPQPLLAAYNVEVDMGVLRTPMDGGLAKQRRLYDVMPHHFQLSFAIPWNQLSSWQAWVNAYAYEYIEMDLVSWLSTAGSCSPHYVRFTSGIAYSSAEGKLMNCSVEAELSPAQVTNYSPLAGDDWIRGGSPANPSSANNVIAGSPPAPSDGNTVIGGTPDAPSL